MTSTIGCHTIRKDIENFSHIIERIYGSGPRLINANNFLTCSISDVLSASMRKESCVQLIQDAVDLQMKYVGSGGRSVALMVVLWYRCSVNLIEQGIGKNIVLFVLNCAIEDCMKTMKSFKIPIEDITLRDLCKRLSHGCQDWELVYNAVTLLGQFKYSKQINVLHEKSIKDSFVHPGLLVSFPGYVEKTGCQKIVLVCGDLCSDYHHTGYKGLVKEDQIYTPNHVNTTERWSEKIKSLLKFHEITSILFSGKIDHDISEYCNRNKICLIGTSYELLRKIAEIAGVEMLPYLDGCSARDIGDVMFEQLDDQWISITNGKMEFVTIVLRSCISIKGYVEMMKSVVCRVREAMESLLVLPGGGQTEKKLVQILSCPDDVTIKDLTYPEWMLEDMNLYKKLIYQSFSDTLLRTEHLSRSNRGNQSDSFHDLNFDKLDTIDKFDNLSVDVEDVEAYDVLSVKVSAWKRAFEVTRVLLSIDLAMKPPLQAPES